ncbi:ARM repeat-containing protein [Ascoidea rubescens DSM 1968]|uniref:ARM repeat-containing protein n=1 Tax=Ascoidea rubescens DSM 1968 TaxID=1344418 RepID=A0A1D2VDF4_9ASCO|nr:ARM repeat-containing protein [Ascoidea rubescens DSM 1968]ODV59540.1 ARM repeat-containing protein [Ascoidea rubescens DSM 1968]
MSAYPFQSCLPDNINLELLVLLDSLSSADNFIRSNAEHSLNSNWLSSKDQNQVLLVFLAEQASFSQNVSSRAFSAVIFRRIAIKSPIYLNDPLAKSISVIPNSSKSKIRSILLQGFNHPDQPINIRHKLADAIAELAKSDVSPDWPDLLESIINATTNQSLPSIRESAFRLISQTPDLINVSHINQFLPVFQNGFNDENDEVLIACSNAFVAYFEVLPKQSWQLLATLLPDLMNILPKLLNNGKDSSLSSVLESLILLIELAPKLFKDMFEKIIEFCSLITKNKNLEQNCRISSLELLTTFSEVSPQMCKSNSNYINSIIILSLSLMTELSPDDDEYSDWVNNTNIDDDEDEIEYDSGRQTLDRVSLALGGQSLVDPLFHFLTQMISSTSWRERQAALMAISSASEGCRDVLINKIDAILNLILPLLNDPHPRVQYACCNTLGQISTDFATTTQVQYGYRIIPALISKLTNDSITRVQTHAAAALVNFSENASKEVLEPYLDDLLTNLLILLQGNCRYVQEQVLTTIAVVADSAEQKFLKYYDALMPVLINFLKTDNENSDIKLLKAKCIECSTLIALAVGYEKFQAHYDDLINIFVNYQQSITDENDQMIPYLQQGWGRLCRIIGPQFVPYLQLILPPILKSAKYQQDIAILDEDQANELEQNQDWDVIQLGTKHIGVHTSILDEKVSSIELLKTYCVVLKQNFYPYVKEIATQIILPGLDFYLHDGVRRCCALTMPSLLRFDSRIILSDETLKLWKSIVDKIVSSLISETSTELLISYYECLIECLCILDQDNAVTDDQLLYFAKAIYKNLLECYKRIKERESNFDEYSEELEDNNDVDVDEELLDNINSFIKFVFKFRRSKLIVLINILLNDNQDLSIKSCGFNIIADMIEFCGPDSYLYKDLFEDTLKVNLANDTNLQIKQLSIYIIGLCSQYGGRNYNGYCLNRLTRLFYLATIPETSEIAVVSVSSVCSNAEGEELVLWLKTEVPKIMKILILAAYNRSIIAQNAKRLVQCLKILLGKLGNEAALQMIHTYPAETQHQIQKLFTN